MCVQAGGSRVLYMKSIVSVDGRAMPAGVAASRRGGPHWGADTDKNVYILVMDAPCNQLQLRFR